MLLKSKKQNFHIKILTIFMLLFLCLSSVSVFANNNNASGSPTTTWTAFETGAPGTTINVVLSFFTSNIMRGICMVLLGILSVGILTNRGEPGMIKKFVPWIVGISLLLGLSLVMGIIWKPNQAAHTFSA